MKKYEVVVGCTITNLYKVFKIDAENEFEALKIALVGFATSPETKQAEIDRQNSEDYPTDIEKLVEIYNENYFSIVDEYDSDSVLAKHWFGEIIYGEISRLGHIWKWSIENRKGCPISPDAALVYLFLNSVLKYNEDDEDDIYIIVTQKTIALGCGFSPNEENRVEKAMQELINLTLFDGF